MLTEVVNDKKEIDYDRIVHIAEKVCNGTAEITRLNRQEEQGRIEGGRRNVEASLYLGAAKGTNQTEHTSSGEVQFAKRTGEDTRDIDEIAIEQDALLEEYAKKAGIWYTSQRIKEEIENKSLSKTKGNEADVYFMPDGTVIKTVLYNIAFSRTPMEFLDNRISLYNSLFRENKYELIGFAEDIDKDKGEPGIVFIIKQKTIIDGRMLQNHVEDAKNKSEAEIQVQNALAKHLSDKLDLNPSNERMNAFHNSNYKIKDVHLGNVMESETENILIDPDTHLYFIDVAPELNTDKAIGGLREYNDFTVTEILSVNDEQLVINEKGDLVTEGTFGTEETEDTVLSTELFDEKELPSQVTGTESYNDALDKVEALIPRIDNIEKAKFIVEHIEKWMSDIDFKKMISFKDADALNLWLGTAWRLLHVVRELNSNSFLMNTFRKRGVEEDSILRHLRVSIGTESSVKVPLENRVKEAIEIINSRTQYLRIWNYFSSEINRDTLDLRKGLRLSSNPLKNECEAVIREFMLPLFNQLLSNYRYENRKMSKVNENESPLFLLPAIFSKAKQSLEEMMGTKEAKSLGTDTLNRIYENMTAAIEGVQKAWTEFINSENEKMAVRQSEEIEKIGSDMETGMISPYSSDFKRLSLNLAMAWKAVNTLSSGDIAANMETVNELRQRVNDIFQNLMNKIQEANPGMEVYTEDYKPTAEGLEATVMFLDEMAKSSKLSRDYVSELKKGFQTFYSYIHRINTFSEFTGSFFKKDNNYRPENFGAVMSVIESDPFVSKETWNEMYASDINEAELNEDRKNFKPKTSKYYGINPLFNEYIDYYIANIDKLKKLQTAIGKYDKLSFSMVLLKLYRDKQLTEDNGKLTPFYLALSLIINKVRDQLWAEENRYLIDNVPNTVLSDLQKKEQKEKIDFTLETFKRIAEFIESPPTINNPQGIQENYFDPNTGFLNSGYLSKVIAKHESLNNIDFIPHPAIGFNLLSTLKRDNNNYDYKLDRYKEDTTEYEGEQWAYTDLIEAFEQLHSGQSLTIGKIQENGSIPLYMDFKGRQLKVGAIDVPNFNVKGVKFTISANDTDEFRSPYETKYGKLLQKSLFVLSKNKAQRNQLNKIYAIAHTQMYEKGHLSPKNKKDAADALKMFVTNDHTSDQNNAVLVRAMMGTAFINNEDFKDNNIDIESINENNITSILSVLDPLYYNYAEGRDILKADWDDLTVEKRYGEFSAKWRQRFEQIQDVRKQIEENHPESVTIASVGNLLFNYKKDAMLRPDELFDEPGDIQIIAHANEKEYSNGNISKTTLRIRDVRTGRDVTDFKNKESHHVLYMAVQQGNKKSYIPLNSSVLGEVEGQANSQGLSTVKLNREFVTDSIMDILNAKLDNISTNLQEVTRQYTDESVTVRQILDGLSDVIIVNSGVDGSIAKNPLPYYFDATRTWDLTEDELKQYGEYATGGKKHRIEFKTLSNISDRTGLHKVVLNEITRVIVNYGNDTREFIRFRSTGTVGRERKDEKQKPKEVKTIVNTDIGLVEASQTSWGNNLLYPGEHTGYIEYTDVIKEKLRHLVELKSMDMVRALNFQQTAIASKKSKTGVSYRDKAEEYYYKKHGIENPNYTEYKDYTDYAIKTGAVFTNLQPVRNKSGKIITLRNPNTKLVSNLKITVEPQMESVNTVSDDTLDLRYFYSMEKKPFDFETSLNNGFLEYAGLLNRDENQTFIESIPDNWKSMKMTAKDSFDYKDEEGNLRDMSNKFASYNSESNTLTWNLSSRVTDSKRIMVRTLMHELIHNSFKNMSAENYQKGMEFARDAVSEIKNNASSYSVLNRFIPLMDENLTLEELFTYGLTDINFRNALDSIPASNELNEKYPSSKKNESVWSKILSFVFKLLGIKAGRKGSLTEKIENVFIELMGDEKNRTERKQDLTGFATDVFYERSIDAEGLVVCL
jgi:hypothetical protein